MTDKSFVLLFGVFSRQALPHSRHGKLRLLRSTQPIKSQSYNPSMTTFTQAHSRTSNYEIEITQETKKGNGIRKYLQGSGYSRRGNGINQKDTVEATITKIQDCNQYANQSVEEQLKHITARQ